MLRTVRSFFAPISRIVPMPTCLVIVLLLPLFFPAVCATEHTLPAPGGVGSLSQLTALINNALVVSGDTIILQSGVWKGCNPTPVVLRNKNLVIRGESPGSVLIDCENNGGFLSTASGCLGGELADLVVTNTSTNTILLSHACTLVLNNVDVSGSGGRAMYLSTGSVVMNTCKIHHNKQGGVLGDASTNVTLNGCVVTDNVATSQSSYGGGGIFTQGQLTATNTTIAKNTAYFGGGVYGYGTSSSITLNGCVVTDNVATSGDGYGGGIYTQGQLTATNTTIAKNTANHGGGVFGASSSITLNGCVVTDNVASRGYGGGIYTKGQLTATNTTIAKNTANYGGGVCGPDTSSITLNGCVVTDNVATSGGGGGIYTKGQLTATNTTIANNTAIYGGGGVYSDKPFSLFNSRIIQNTPDGVYCSSPLSITTDSSSLICGNKNSQANANCVIDRRVVCGTITSVSVPGMVGNTIYKDMNIKLQGTGWTTTSDAMKEVILGSITTTSFTSTGTPPTSLALTAPGRSELEVGPIMTRSVDGVKAMTYQDYTFGGDSLADCVVSVVSGPEPPAIWTSVNSDKPVTFTLSSSCFTTMQFRLSFNNTKHDMTVPITSIVQDVTLTLPASATACVIPLEVYLVSPRSQHLLNTTLEYYDAPVVNSTLPAVVHSKVTSVRVCGTGIVGYDWSKPTCMFDSLEVSGVISDDCITCPFSSSLPCAARPNVNVKIALYTDQYVSANSVQLVCLPVSYHSVSLTEIVISETMDSNSIFVFGNLFYPTDYYHCKYSSATNSSMVFLTPGAYIDSSAMTCQLPKLSEVCKLELSVTVNDQDYINVTSLRFYNNLDCPAGSENKGSICKPCAVGDYKEDYGPERCKLCGSLMTTNSTGTTSWLDCVCINKQQMEPDVTKKGGDGCSCKIGYEGDNNGCVLCPIGTYGGKGRCVECPPLHTTHKTGATSSTMCKCVDGYFELASKCVECLPYAACGFDATRNKPNCTIGYEGDRCSRCSVGYYRSQLECLECSRTSGWWINTLLMCGTLAVLVYLYHESLKGPRSSDVLAAISVTYSFLQVFALVGSAQKEDEIPEPLRSMLASFSKLNFNMVALECSMPSITFYGYMALKMALLPMCLAVVWLLVCLSVKLRGRLPFFSLLTRMTTREIVYAGVSTTTLLITLLYLVETQAVLSFASCTHLTNGPWVLDASPDIECFGSQHIQWLALFVLGLVVYVLGVPLALWYVIVHKRKALLDKGELPEWYDNCFGFLSARYHSYVYYWELVVLLRKAALVAAFTIWSRSILVKLEVTIFVLVTALYYQNWYKPMMSPDVDSMESRSLFMNSMSLLATIGVFVANSEAGLVTDTSKTFLYIMFVGIVCGCALVVFWLLVLLWQHKGDVMRSRATSLKGRGSEPLLDYKDDDVYVSFTAAGDDEQTFNA